MIYMFNQLDRSNLGNAQSNNFSADLGIPSSSVNTATTLFFVTYVPLQPVRFPHSFLLYTGIESLIHAQFAAALGKKVGVTRFVGVICCIWGILAICNAFVVSQAAFLPASI